MKIYYVYALVDPRNNLPFYIGKGKGDRMNDHLNGRAINGKKKINKITEIRLAGFEPIAMKLFENLDEKAAYDLEDEIILILGREEIEEHGILTNNRLNCHGPVMTTDVRTAISNWRKGIKFTKEHKENLRRAKKGKTWKEIFGVEGAELKRQQNSAPKGPMSEERKRNISLAKKGMKAPHGWTQESRDKVRAALLGKKKNISPEKKEEKRLANKTPIICPHCNKVGTGLSMKRWHLDNCKHKI